jgi:hypothetical protein
MALTRFTLAGGHQVDAPTPPEGYTLHHFCDITGVLLPPISVDNMMGLNYWNGKSWTHVTHLPMLGIPWYATKAP